MGIKEVLLALILVGVSFGISFLKKLDLEKDLLIGTLRSFVQLIAVGYALELVFNLNNLWLIFLVILIMVMVGGQTAGSRTKGSLKGFTISTFSIGVGTFFTLGGLLLLGVINADPKYVIPLAGMTIGNSTTASALALERMHSEMKKQEGSDRTGSIPGSNLKPGSRAFFQSYGQGCNDTDFEPDEDRRSGAASRSNDRDDLSRRQSAAGGETSDNRSLHAHLCGEHSGRYHGKTFTEHLFYEISSAGDFIRLVWWKIQRT